MYRKIYHNSKGNFKETSTSLWLSRNKVMTQQIKHWKDRYELLICTGTFNSVWKVPGLWLFIDLCRDFQFSMESPWFVITLQSKKTIIFIIDFNCQFLNLYLLRKKTVGMQRKIFDKYINQIESLECKNQVEIYKSKIVIIKTPTFN